MAVGSEQRREERRPRIEAEFPSSHVEAALDLHVEAALDLLHLADMALA